MRTKRRRSSKRLGWFRVNRSGLARITSVTMRLPFGRTLVVWERPR